MNRNNEDEVGKGLGQLPDRIADSLQGRPEAFAPVAGYEDERPPAAPPVPTTPERAAALAPRHPIERPGERVDDRIAGHMDCCPCHPLGQEIGGRMLVGAKWRSAMRPIVRRLISSGKG